MGAIAHGPTLLARADGVTVGLRSIVAYTSGLDLAVVVVATGVHADALQRQYTAPAIIDPATGRRRPGETHGRPLRLRALEDSVLQPIRHRDGQGYQSPEMYQREYLFELTPLPDAEDLPLIAEWPEIGLRPVTTHLTLPPPAELAAAIIPLP
ncbi:hypothetical protein P3H15_33540 [Rhodococcus sp. T2V]|uniref:hypothetical protein n=1 Tax=Rhodococcus sp. T2V TaxID=3034164 RepID=UPI0023E2CBF1|nr:hypothetical protein [Rhodococcus sp. T2V]MDF3309941.1 hypothetical protein [Rhodococcus sp. T2V]